MDFNFGAHDNGVDDLMSASFDYQSDEEMEPTTEPQPQPEQQHEQEPEQETQPDTQPETQPETQPDRRLNHQPTFSQELIPSVERTASVDEPSQVSDPANNEVGSNSPSRLKGKDNDSMDFTHDYPSNGEQQHQPSKARTLAIEEPARTPEDPKSESISSTASPQPGQPTSPTSLTPQIASASIFGGSLSKPPPTYKPAPSIFGGQPTPSIFGGPVQRASTSKAAQAPQSDDDNDFDFMIIDPREASVAAKQKWSSNPPQNSQGDVVFIKEERRDDSRRTPTPPPVRQPTPPVRMPPPPRKPLDPAKIMAAQRAMLQRNQAQNNGEGSSRGHMRPARPVHFDHFEDNTFGISDQVDADMRDVNEDNSWMDEEDENDLEYEKLLKLKNSLVRKQRAKTITADESLHLYKTTQQMATRERLRAAASRNDDEEPEEDPDSLFLPETREETVGRRRRELRRRVAAEEDRRRQAESEDVESDPGDNAGDGEYNEDDAMAGIMAEEDTPEAEPDLGLTKAGKPRKRRAKVAKGPKEYMDRQDEKRREKERAKAQKKKGRQPAAAAASRRKVKSPVTRGRGRPKANDKGKGKEKEKPAKKGRKAKGLVTNGQSLLASGKFRSFNNVDPVGHMILEDLMNNDPISDRLQNPIFNRPAEETISGHQTKTTQFQLLFANIPEPEDALTRGAVRSDKAKLRDASKSFGYAKCKAKDGKWLIKGMKSTLYHHQLLGAQWMVQRELSSQPPHGGLLADSMGLGKTVQTLACMVANPPGPGKSIALFFALILIAGRIIGG